MSAWRCSCGRTVPLEVEFCRCGRSRTVETAAPTRSTTSDGNTIRQVGAIALIGVLGWIAYRWYASYTPPEIPGYNAPPSNERPADTNVPPASAPAVPAPAVPRPAAVAEPVPAQEPIATAPVAPTSPAPAATDAGARTAAAPQEAPTETPSESDQFRARIAAFRAEYAPLKIRIEQLEREIGTLGETVARSLGAGVTAGEAARTRLSAAEKELERARTQLADVEDRARRAGVSYSQLN